ncbi:putative NRPS-like protein biosynthetic cluster [Diaporthe australafricana]|uniref:NRPS-like protein biosynthetic cluster n=1 Tax=Diaporthe australafricana TaxID=127596 RepID=A0ABR3XN67_9PEZI
MAAHAALAKGEHGDETSLSVVEGPRLPPLWNKTLADLIKEQASKHADREAVVVPWQSARMTYARLGERSALMAKSLLAYAGLKRGDCVGIMAGNCFEYIEIFLGAGRIGCPVAVFNNTFSPNELKAMIERTEVGSRSLAGHMRMVLNATQGELPIRRLISLADVLPPKEGLKCETYKDFMSSTQSILVSDHSLSRAERRVTPSDVVNLQFTSGVDQTSCNVINDGRYIGLAIHLTEQDVMCCPPPLFHAFGLVIGFLTSYCHGSKIVFPSPTFDASAAINAVVQEKVTALLGVPLMFLSMLEVLKQTPRRIETVRTGIAGGSSVSPALINRLQREMNMPCMHTAFGMTETGPVTFISSVEDSHNKIFDTVGKALPHTGGKIVDNDGNIVPRGTRGQICTSGFALQKGYLKDEVQTAQAMKSDEAGVRWMHTGDEGFIDQAGYMHITGRIKDIIIRGGENISPVEIEDRLLEHPSVNECCVVGLDDALYGEVVSCFLGHAGGVRPVDQEIRDWVTTVMDRIRAPRYIFWLGEEDIGRELPKTGSGKYKKQLIRAKGNALVKSREVRAKI